MILTWSKPPKKMSTEEWKSISADGAPPGVYVPNMSEADARKWRAKMTGTRKGEPQVEIRKTVGSSQMVIVVGLDGYDYGAYYARDPERGPSTRGKNIHVSLNGPAQLTFDEFREFNEAVAEATVVLEQWTSEFPREHKVPDREVGS